MLDIIRLADRLGVEFAFPTETVHLYQEAADTTPAPEPPPGAGHEQQAMADGRRAARQLTGSADWRHSKPEPYTFTKVSPDDDETQIESTSGGDAS
jgi:MscS family membrane protein